MSAFDGQKVKPYKSSKSKKEEVRDMFNHISGSYDFLNHFLSLNIDRQWRRVAINFLKPSSPCVILDVATGTGDMAFEAVRLNPEKITGIDISDDMLDIARKKSLKKGNRDLFSWLTADAESLPFKSGEYDAVTVAFGVRNFEDPLSGLTEIRRVLKGKGKLVVLEFIMPETFPVKQLFGFYFKRILPCIGKTVSKDYEAYSYLQNSVEYFYQRKGFIDLLNQTGFTDISFKTLWPGMAGLYTATK